MNVLRKHVSRIKGGRLAAAAHPARVVSLIVSDIPGDNPALVASGPTVPDRSDRPRWPARSSPPTASTCPSAVMRPYRRPACAAPSPDDPVFARNEVRIIASAAVSLEAAADPRRTRGLEAVILSDAIEGEARDVAQVHAAHRPRDRRARSPRRGPGDPALGRRDHGDPARQGQGRAQRRIPAVFAAAIEGLAGIHALAADTDGIDGSEDNAGGFVDGATAARIRAAGADPRALLSGNDAWTALDRAGDLLVTGPTGTNVNDFRAILIA